MQPFYQTFLALLLAHVLGDFPLQTSRMVRGKVAFHLPAFFSHALVHLAASAAALAIFTPVPLLKATTVAALALLILSHLALDFGKSAIVRRKPEQDGAMLYIADQLFHVVIVALAAAVAVQAAPFGADLAGLWRHVSDVTLVYFAVVAATVFPAGYLIRYLLQPLSRQLAVSRDHQALERESLEGLSNAGLYLGWLERGLLVVAFAMGSFTAVGLIIGAKSVARFPEFKSRAFAEYFLIGTLISVAIAAAGGWILRTLLNFVD